MLIKNFNEMATSNERRMMLEIINAGLESIQPEAVMKKNFSLQENTLTISHKTYDLTQFQRIFLIGFGKGSAGISKRIEAILGDRLTDGYVIDTTEEEFQKIHFTQGTHPLPSKANHDFTQQLLVKFAHIHQVRYPASSLF